MTRNLNCGPNNIDNAVSLVNCGATTVDVVNCGLTEVYSVAAVGNQVPVAPVAGPFADVCTDGDVVNVTHGGWTDPDGDTIALSATGLPANLTFTDNGDGSYTITGTCDDSGLGTYSVTANDGNGGSTTQTGNTFNQQPVALQPPVVVCPANQVIDLGDSITGDPVNSGGVAASWAIAPALPNGFSFNTATGEITGAATATSANTTYTVTATNAAGSNSCMFDLTVNLVVNGTIQADPGASLLTLHRGQAVPADATFLRINTDGTFQFESQDGSFLYNDASGSWVSPAGASADWEIYFEPSFPSDPASGLTIDGPNTGGVWTSVNADQIFGFGLDNAGSQLESVDIHFRPAGSGFNIGDPGTTTWVVQITGDTSL